jgi:tol-pal system protein YbgF
LKQRIEQLEEQLVDMQVVIGTLQSLARGGASGGGGRADPGAGSAAEMRIDGLETQLRALSAQVDQLTQQVRALSGAPPRRSEAAPPAATGTVPSSAAAPTAHAAAGQAAGGQMPTAAAGGPEVSRFGSTTVTSDTGDAIGGLLDSEAPHSQAQHSQAPQSQAAPTDTAHAVPAGTASNPASAPQGAHPQGAQPLSPAAQDAAGAGTAASEKLAAAPPTFMPPQRAPGATDNPKQLYETAYGYLMQRDYSSAQTAFEEFLTRYPKDSLAGNAQYWLGEAHFVRGEYKAAAGAFLKGYKEYGSNPRAADSLLKLAMSLDRLGQTDAACSSFNELTTRFPDAPDNVKSRAKTERVRIGCR